MLSSQDLIKDNTKREDVCPSIGAKFHENFRRHISRSSAQSAGGCNVLNTIWSRTRGQLFGQPKIKNLDRSGLREHDVFRLDVAVDDPGSMSCFQCVSALHGDFE